MYQIKEWQDQRFHAVSPVMFWQRFNAALRGRYNAELLYEAVRVGITVKLETTAYRLT